MVIGQVLAPDALIGHHSAAKSPQYTLESQLYGHFRIKTKCSAGLLSRMSPRALWLLH